MTIINFHRLHRVVVHNGERRQTVELAAEEVMALILIAEAAKAGDYHELAAALDLLDWDDK